MARYTITIEDQDDGVNVSLSGPAAMGPSRQLATALAKLATPLLGMIAQSHIGGACPCASCTALRQKKAGDKPTLH